MLRAIYEDPTLEPPAVLWVPTNIYDDTPHTDMVNIVSNTSVHVHVPRVVYGGISTPHRSLLKPLADPIVRQVGTLVVLVLVTVMHCVKFYEIHTVLLDTNVGCVDISVRSILMHTVLLRTYLGTLVV